DSIRKLLGGDVCRIKYDFIPFENHQFISGGDAVGLNKVIVDVEMADAVGDFQVEGENIQQITLPRNGLPIRLEFEAREICDGSIGPVLTGNPFRVVER